MAFSAAGSLLPGSLKPQGATSSKACGPARPVIRTPAGFLRASQAGTALPHTPGSTGAARMQGPFPQGPRQPVERTRAPLGRACRSQRRVSIEPSRRQSDPQQTRTKTSSGAGATPLLTLPVPPVLAAGLRQAAGLRLGRYGVLPTRNADDSLLLGAWKRAKPMHVATRSTTQLLPEPGEWDWVRSPLPGHPSINALEEPAKSTWGNGNRLRGAFPER